MRDELIVDTAVSGGPGDSPLVKAKALADAYLRHEATSEEIAWLHTHPRLWLRALTWFVEDVNLQIAVHRDGMKAVELDAAGLRRAQETLTKRRYFLKICESQIREVEELVGDAQLGPTAGQIMSGLLRALALLDMNAGGEARGVLNGMLGQIAKHADLGPAPDNFEADPIAVPVTGLRLNTRLNCRACGRGKINPHDTDPRCPMCWQLHRINPGPP